MEAFHTKFKKEEGKKWLLKEEDLPKVVATVNEMGIEKWTAVGWALKALMFEFNLRKGGKKIIK